ncbi:hypothetical protein BO71DRAFT_224462 [Aspergillus ellipticus CBS 707.79]|uniref:Uncharacterized protein n=1 Tax=Aspergillus ellipticus CBS 707.79 TaxID=1448320 RepID=A0A319DTV6_9EURO|nr:hypothetical protein BO71DRAFT_224462 [Aspergillus ellipticus CBS 707.79]
MQHRRSRTALTVAGHGICLFPGNRASIHSELERITGWLRDSTDVTARFAVLKETSTSALLQLPVHSLSDSLSN